MAPPLRRVLAQSVVAIPLALGFKTGITSLLLASLLVAEACTQYAWFLPSAALSAPWPSWHYRAHIRSHFFLNTAVAGGVLLLQSSGAGMLTLDAALAGKQE